uniref:arginase family protein n=1 Tax=Thaumasiovibrio occultus TaxID=1891184 RepID=UPI000B34E509|nr:arginase family protein [Thaumasiovibrio occultus]
MSRHFAILGAPFNRCSHEPSRENTVAPLRRCVDGSWFALGETIAQRSGSAGLHVRDAGDVEVTPDIEQLFARGEVSRAAQRYMDFLQGKVSSMLASGEIPITLGGDHSIAIGTLRAVLNDYQERRGERVAVIWFDAHVDLNTQERGNLHGKPLAVLSHTTAMLDWVGPRTPKLDLANVIHVGIRDLMAVEKTEMARHDMTTFDMGRIDQLGFERVLSEIMVAIETQFDRVYISLDYDVLEGALFRACATPNIGGLMPRELLHAVHIIAKSDKFVGGEIVEYLPQKDHDLASRELVIKLVDAMLGFRI